MEATNWKSIQKQFSYILVESLSKDKRLCLDRDQTLLTKVVGLVNLNDSCDSLNKSNMQSRHQVFRARAILAKWLESYREKNKINKTEQRPTTFYSYFLLCVIEQYDDVRWSFWLDWNRFEPDLVLPVSHWPWWSSMFSERNQSK